MAKPIALNRTEKMVKLWAHETCRVFHDRLVNNEDKKWLTEQIVDMTRNIFRMDWSHEDLFERKPLIFSDFMKKGVPCDERIYDEIKDSSTMTQVIIDY